MLSKSCLCYLGLSDQRRRLTSSTCLQVSGKVTTSIQWGAWGGNGMAVRTPGFMERMARLGLGIVEPYVGVTVLAQVLSIACSPLRSSVNQHALFTGGTSYLNGLVFI